MVFTVLVFIAEVEDVHFNEPITKFIPELAANTSNAGLEAVRHVNWDDVTIGGLASQMTWTGCDCKFLV